jgi:membrane protease YdiL (CAAX protease family)
MPATPPAGSRCVRWIAGHPVAALLLWFFTVGQAIAFVPLVASSYGSDLPEQPFTTASTWVGLLLPALAITCLLHGRRATWELLRLTAVPAAVRWYVLCLLGIPLTSLLIAVAMVGVPVESTPSAVASACLVGFGAQALLHLVTNNLWEELAWTGFVTARLQARHAPLTVALLTGPLFALQHSPLVLDAGPGGLVVLLALVVLAVPFRMVMSWIFNRTGSLLLVGLAHACGNAVVTGTVLGDALLPALYGRGLGPVHLFAYAVIGLVAAVATRGRLGLDDGVPTTPRVHGPRERAEHGA